MYEYRLTVNTTVTIQSSYPSWSSIFQQCNERGYCCLLERRLVVRNPDLDWLEGLKDFAGNLPPKSMLLEGLFIQGWETVASNSERLPLLVA